MSDPNRYNIAANQAQRTLGGNILVVDPNGQLVSYEDYAKLKAAGNLLSKQVMVAMLSGNAHEELIAAHAAWKDTADRPPNWGKTCTKPPLP